MTKTLRHSNWTYALRAKGAVLTNAVVIALAFIINIILPTIISG